MRKLRGRLVGAVVLATSCALAACSNDTASTTVVIVTSVAVDPLDFLGTVPCGPQAGAAQSYVATLTDYTSGVTLAPSRAISCLTPVSFENVVPGHTYWASIQVYDVDASQVGAGTTAQWNTTCGNNPNPPVGTISQSGAAIVYTDQRIFVGGCVSLTGQGVGTTTVSVDASNLVGAACALPLVGQKDPVPIAKLTVTSPGSGLAGQTIACGQGPVTFETGVTANTTYAFRVEAFQAGATSPTWASNCAATSKEGVDVPASCDGLSNNGYIRIDAAAAIASEKLACAQSGAIAVGTYDVSFGDAPNTVEAQGVSCSTNVLLGPFVAGPASGEVTLRSPGGVEVGHSACTANVSPRDTTIATCVPN